MQRHARDAKQKEKGNDNGKGKNNRKEVQEGDV